MVIRFLLSELKSIIRIIRFFKNIVNHGNSFLQNQNQSKCNSFQKETKREIISCFMTQKNDYIIHNSVYSGNSIIRDRKRDEHKSIE